ncbi:hypothetical protein ACIBLA_24010 [Streptomyces sp. NPDC050433]|uniref:hypothetical protein n=1 Tax=Streptomyces sp. NPDC050433 TaxID=3365615 RepID=UPI0037AE662A
MGTPAQPRDGSPDSRNSSKDSWHSAAESFTAVRLHRNNTFTLSSDEVPQTAPQVHEGAVAAVYVVNSNKDNKKNPGEFFTIDESSQIARWSESAGKWVSQQVKKNGRRVIRALIDAAPSLIQGSQVMTSNETAKLGLKATGTLAGAILGAQGLVTELDNHRKGKPVDWVNVGSDVVRLGAGAAGGYGVLGPQDSEVTSTVDGAGVFAAGLATGVSTMHHQEEHKDPAKLKDEEQGLGVMEWPVHYEPYAKYIYNNGDERSMSAVTMRLSDGSTVEADPKNDRWLEYYTEQYIANAKQSDQVAEYATGLATGSASAQQAEAESSHQWPAHYEKYAEHIYNNGDERSMSAVTMRLSDGTTFEVNPEKDRLLKQYTEQYIALAKQSDQVAAHASTGLATGSASAQRGEAESSNVVQRKGKQKAAGPSR